MLDAYYKGFGSEVESLFAGAGIGWHYETGIQILQLVLEGVFERFPNRQIVTGHWGEVMLFYLDRVDILSRPAHLPHKISEYVQRRVSVTPSGMYSHRFSSGRSRYWAPNASCSQLITPLPMTLRLHSVTSSIPLRQMKRFAR